MFNFFSRFLCRSPARHARTLYGGALGGSDAQALCPSGYLLRTCYATLRDLLRSALVTGLRPGLLGRYLHRRGHSRRTRPAGLLAHASASI